MPRRRATVALRFHVDGSVASRVFTDSGWLVMMLINLLSNALKHTREGEVILTASTTSQRGSTYPPSLPRLRT